MIPGSRASFQVAIAFVLVALLGGFATSARSAPIRVYSDAAAFAASTANRATDTYDDLTAYVGQETPGPSSALPRTVGAYSYVATSTSPFGIDCFFTGVDPSDPSQTDLWLGTNYQPDYVTFDGFGRPISAIGGYFFATDYFDDPTTTPIRVTIVLADLSSQVVTLTAPDAATFLGFATDGIGIQSLRIDNLAPGTDPDDPTVGTFVTINDLVLAQAVPEPELVALLALGALAGLAARPRRRTPR